MVIKYKNKFDAVIDGYLISNVTSQKVRRRNGKLFKQLDFNSNGFIELPNNPER